MIRAMNVRLAAACVIAALLALGGVIGCESSGSSSYHVSTGYYGGPGWDDPYYYESCCHGDVIVGRPPGYRPGDRPGGPGHRPPSAGQLPSMPSRPRPAPRGGGGGRRR
jgi:hypothetical protein